MKKRHDYGARALALHKRFQGKLATVPLRPLKKRGELALIYTPGVGAVSSHLARHKKDAREYTLKGRTVAVVSDGSAVLGLGNIGPEGALPVMEGKAVLFKMLAGLDAFPIVLDTQDPKEIVETVTRIAPAFGGINLEDIAAPKCFAIEEELKRRLSIPVMHDDQHGTAIVTLAGLINAFRVAGKNLNHANTRVVVNGAGAAGIAVIRLLKRYAPKVSVIALDSQGIIGKGRKDLLGPKKALLAERLVVGDLEGGLADAMVGADAFVGLSKPGVLTGHMVRTMKQRAIVFAMANPIPEILPDEAKRAGAYIVATGRSDFPNQINNALVFPGLFRGALDRKVRHITDEMKARAAVSLARVVQKPSRTEIIPDVLDPRVVPAVARAVR